MKKIASILLAALIVCSTMFVTLLPAFAEDATVVKPIEESGKIKIGLYTPGNYIVKENCTIDNLDVSKGKLTIASGCTVIVKDALHNAGILIIEQGAFLTHDDTKANGIHSKGTIYVYGAFETFAANFMNYGTINVHGTLNCSGCTSITNDNTINIYSDGYFIEPNGMSSGSGKINSSLKCDGDHSGCNHNFNNSKCNECGYVCTHANWNDGKCAKCGFACTHVNWNDGKCAKCGCACTHDIGFDENHKCKDCGFECTHSNRKIICTECGKTLEETTVHNPTGSVLSEGSLVIIVGVACLAVGFLAAMFIFRKNKPALSSGTDNTDED